MTPLSIQFRALKKKMYLSLKRYHFEFVSFGNIENEENTHSKILFENFRKLMSNSRGRTIHGCLSPVERWRIFCSLYRNTESLEPHKALMNDLCDDDDVCAITEIVTEDQSEIFDFMVRSKNQDKDVLYNIMAKTLEVNLNPNSHKPLFLQYERKVNKIIETKKALDLKDKKDLNEFESDQLEDLENESVIITQRLHQLSVLFFGYKDKHMDIYLQSKELYDSVKRYVQDLEKVK